MVRGERYRRTFWSRPLAALACGLLCLVAGCGDSASPEQTAAIARLQQLGARINFKRGGYEVDLKESAISNGDLVHLQKISNLRTVQLVRTRISDDGLEYLKPIKTLEHVDLTGPLVSRQALAELKQALPDATVVP
jgi:hypothetical protein